MKLHYFLPLFFALSLGLVAKPDAEAETDDNITVGPALTLEVTAPEKALTAIGPQRGFKAVLHNHGTQPFTLVMPGDGSDAGMRTPKVGWTVKPVTPVAPGELVPEMARCGNINGFNASEIFVLKPGEKKDLGGWIGGVSFPGAGEYDIQFQYENDPNLKMKGLVMRPPGGPDPYDAVKKTDAVNVVSAKLRVKVGAGNAQVLQREIFVPAK